MLKFSTSLPVYNWVKNVYSLCIEGGVTCVSKFTGSRNSYTTHYTYRVQPTSYTHLSKFFTPALYTAFFRNFNLLNIHLYTLSTAPINTKTKEK